MLSHFYLPQPLQGGEWCSEVTQSINLKSPQWGDLEGLKKKSITILVHYFFPVTYLFCQKSEVPLKTSFVLENGELLNSSFLQKILFNSAKSPVGTFFYLPASIFHLPTSVFRLPTSDSQPFKTIFVHFVQEPF